MAKELPYFQFEPAEYLTKDISFCSLAAQGLFINICSYYWQRECLLTKVQILRRFNHPDLLNELIIEKVLTLNGEDVKINFLYEQYYGVMKKIETSSEKGKIGNLKRWNRAIYDKYIAGKLSLDDALLIAKKSGGEEKPIADPIAEPSHIIEDEIIEDESKENEKTETEIETELLPSIKDSNLFRTPVIPTYEEVHLAFRQNGGTEEQAKTFYDKNSSVGWFFKGSPITNFRNLIDSYISNWQKFESKANGSQVKNQTIKID